MTRPSFRSRLKPGEFNVLVEFTPRTQTEVDKLAEFSRKLVEVNSRLTGKGIRAAAITITMNPAGRLSYEAYAAVSRLREKGFPEELDLIPHIACKDLNSDALRVLLRSLVDAGVSTVLSLTGDKPLKAQGVFQVDSLGLLDIIRELNVERLLKAKSKDDLLTVPQLESGAAVSPFKYTDASMAMQYIKAEKKIRMGAAFLIAQAGWDSEKSKELIKYFSPKGVPVFGNVLVVDYPTAKVMKNLPGCVVTDRFLEKLKEESHSDAVLRAAQQMAMFRALGYSGADLGNVTTVEEVESILTQALEITDWEKAKNNLDFAPMVDGRKLRATLKSAGIMPYVHNQFFEPNTGGFAFSKKMLSRVEKSRVKEGPLYRLFRLTEAMAKGTFFECQQCGDCYLPEDQFVCTQSQCSKRLPNPPCGDSTIEGMCGNNEVRPCAAEQIYTRAVSRGELDRVRKNIHPARRSQLKQTPSILNYFYGRSHDMDESPLRQTSLIQIGENLHASIPNVGAAMRAMEEMGEEGYTKPNRGLDVILHLIRTQAQLKPSYLDVNIDQLGGDTVTIMKRYMRLIRENGQGIPPCVDSSNPQVLVAGLEEWYKDGNGPAPIVNSIPYHDKEHFEPVFALRAKWEFGVVGLLVRKEGPMKSPEDIYQAARELFQLFRSKGYRPDQIFLDSVTLGVTFDSCIDSEGEMKSSHTHNSFLAIRKIMTDPEMKGCHTVLGISNWGHGVKARRIGHNRAFLHVAMAHGLDAAIVDPTQEFGVKPAPPELIELVEMFVSLDGSEDGMMVYQEKCSDARQKGWL